MTFERSAAKPWERNVRLIAFICVAGLYCIHLWSGVGGIVVPLLFALGNLPFIIIQRDNRPRLLRVLEKSHQEEGREQTYEDADS